jgi:radical SAM enzyme (TIGR01210 family)
LERAFASVGDVLSSIEQISLGNEGSMLDHRTFSRDQLQYVLTTCAELRLVDAIVLETRPEFVTDRLLDEIQQCIAPCKLTLKIGLESADERIRESILRKRMDLDQFERMVCILGKGAWDSLHMS